MRQLRTRSKIFLTGKNRMQGASGFCSARFRSVVFCAPQGKLLPFRHCVLESVCFALSRRGRCPHRPISFPLSFGFLVFRLMRVTFLCSKKSPKKLLSTEFFPSFGDALSVGAPLVGQIRRAKAWHLAGLIVRYVLRQSAKITRCKLCVCKRILVGLCPLAPKNAKHCHSERSEE
jgi:hypothetical protein